MATLDAEMPVTRAELEETLRAEGFQQTSPHVWCSQDRTKFVSFPEDTSGEAIYGDSEIGEPGRTIPIAAAHRVVRGELLLDSPLGVSPMQHPAERALSGRAHRELPPIIERPLLRSSHVRVLSSSNPPPNVHDAEFVETVPAPKPEPNPVVEGMTFERAVQSEMRARISELQASKGRVHGFLIGIVAGALALTAAIWIAYGIVVHRTPERDHDVLLSGAVVATIAIILYARHFHDL
jgi:hypothetical protein